ncbi:hypothetical protein [Streptomyces sp. 7-21]|jgi:hypothetical protein|uniref:hypothetical protein n=1 Tax=Streptomyces sp. 7-21 TaxID=2802283 RepID=UPI00191D9E06|nr:hypothetical protein [Streptomyces sp. 7-21]MBL1068202.1 hypothetical protein [Streptomyces sp. 7-21]
MAHNPQAPHGPQHSQEPDPAGSTQMFQAFVNQGATDRRGSATAGGSSSSISVGMIAGVVLVIAVVIAVAVIAFT